MLAWLLWSGYLPGGLGLALLLGGSQQPAAQLLPAAPSNTCLRAWGCEHVTVRIIATNISILAGALF